MSLSLTDGTGDGVVTPAVTFTIGLSGNTCIVTGEMLSLLTGAYLNFAAIPLLGTPTTPVSVQTWWAIQCDGLGNLTALTSTTAPLTAAAGAVLLYQDVLQTTDLGLDKDPGNTEG